jgi:uncharacterized protein (DUF433 family)
LSEVPNYGMSEASVYLHIPLSTLRYWTLGTDKEEPLVKAAIYRRQPLISFKGLVECYVLEVLRVAHKIDLRKIRYALKTAKEKYPSSHPFADYNLSTERGRIYLDEEPFLADLSVGAQYVIREFVQPALKRVQRNHKGIAERLYPFLRKSQITQTQYEPPRTIVIDPAVSFGMPVLANSRISTAFLASRYRGGDSIPMLARDYDREEREIKEALAWERATQAA